MLNQSKFNQEELFSLFNEFLKQKQTATTTRPETTSTNNREVLDLLANSANKSKSGLKNSSGKMMNKDRKLSRRPRDFTDENESPNKSPGLKSSDKNGFKLRESDDRKPFQQINNTC